VARNIYASLTALRGRVREETLLDCLDFGRTGTVPDATFRSAVANPSCADIDRQLGSVFKMLPDPSNGVFPDISATAPDPTTPIDIQELALDWYVWRLGTMYPVKMQVDTQELWKKITADLKRLREGRDVTNQLPPDHASNVGGTVGSIGADAPRVPPQGFFSDMGDFSRS